MYLGNVHIAQGAEKNPVIGNRPIDIRCKATPEQTGNGVLIAQGGPQYGFAVYVQNEKACFSVRIKGKLTTIISVEPAPKKTFQIEAALAEGGNMSLKIDGVEVASGNAGGLIPVQPGMGFSIGKDTAAPVGEYTLPFAYAGIVSDVVVNGEKRKTPAPVSAEQPLFYTPAEDLAGLAKTQRERNDGLPNVLLIGDSISIGYTPPVRTLLEGIANVERPGTNCGDTRSGLNGLQRWLGTTKWDVIHFNWGLHDLCYRNPESTQQGNRDKINGTIAVPLEEYKTNLEMLVQQLEQTGAALIWAGTTRVPENEAGRFVGDDVKYNAAAEEIMKRHNIAIDDLYALTAGFDPSLCSGPGDVHFNKNGSDKLAEQVAKEITKALQRRTFSAN
jgi:lysophospholipase L1-like esterase